MIGSLFRIANDLGTYGGEAAIGEAATTLQVRKPYMANNMDPRMHPDPNAEDQYNAYRGTVYAAVDKIARRVCQVPMRLWQCEHDLGANELVESEVKFHPFVSLFSDANGRKPHDEYSVWEFVYTHQASLDTTGESWWLTERDELGRPARVTPLPAHRMIIVLEKETGLTAGYYYVPKGRSTDQGGIFIPKMSWKDLQANPTAPFITFFRYPGPKGIEDSRGWSPIKAAAYAYDINLYESIYKRNFLTQGAQLGGILQSEVALNRDQIEEYLDQFKMRHSGVNKAGLPIVLPKMLKWTTTEPTPRDLQWVEAMKLTEGQILQTYGISDAKLGRADIGNRNTADAMDVTFNREVIQSRLDVNRSQINVGFLPIYPGQSDQIYFTCRYDDPVPADGEANLAREAQDITLGVYTRNEVRGRRRDKPMGKFGDQVLIPLANIAVDPWDEGKLEISQDDADKMGLISPEDQAKIDAEQAKLAASLAPKDNGNSGTGAGSSSTADKKGVKKGQTPSGRSLHRTSQDDKALAEVVAYLEDARALDEFNSYLNGLLREAMREEVDIASKLISADPKSVDVDAIAAAFEQSLRTHLAGVNETTARMIREEIAAGLAENETLASIVARIKDVFDKEGSWRAWMIARTETLAATNFAAYAVYSHFAVPSKRWVGTLDERIRDTHAAAHDQVVPLDEPFKVGGARMMFPGDPDGPASEVINCRCTLVPEFGERSIWSDERYSALWKAYDARAQRYEGMVHDAVALVFQQQKARVLSILNTYGK